MSGPARDHERREFGAEFGSLVRITLAPTLWAFHFALSYGTAAVTCAKAGGSENALEALNLGLLALTGGALAGIAWIGWQSWRQWRPRGEALDDSADAIESRHRFLGHASFLLSVISFLGVLLVALPILMVGDCL